MVELLGSLRRCQSSSLILELLPGTQDFGNMADTDLYRPVDVTPFHQHPLTPSRYLRESALQSLAMAARVQSRN